MNNSQITAARLSARGFIVSQTIAGARVILANGYARVEVRDNGYCGHVTSNGERHLFTGLSLPRLTDFLGRF